jgi:hypothetical protein
VTGSHDKKDKANVLMQFVETRTNVQQSISQASLEHTSLIHPSIVEGHSHHSRHGTSLVAQWSTNVNRVLKVQKWMLFEADLTDGYGKEFNFVSCSGILSSIHRF